MRPLLFSLITTQPRLKLFLLLLKPNKEKFSFSIIVKKEKKKISWSKLLVIRKNSERFFFFLPHFIYFFIITSCSLCIVYVTQQWYERTILLSSSFPKLIFDDRWIRFFSMAKSKKNSTFRIPYFSCVEMYYNIYLATPEQFFNLYIRDDKIISDCFQTHTIKKSFVEECNFVIVNTIYIDRSLKFFTGGPLYFWENHLNLRRGPSWIFK